ncbi:hypothetical protein [Nocardia sp. NPDC059239]|uniref:hypothetical protein n=1 Tax=unclassified Nocardia TaxID=2637762 RepID=UPI00367801D3
MTAVVATMSVAAAATAAAEPASPLPAGASEGANAVTEALHYRAVRDADAVVASVETGGFSVDQILGQAILRDAAGTARDSVPLSFVMDGQRYPIDAAISADGRQLRLTPQLRAGWVPPTALQPIASPLENQLAMNDLLNSVSFGLSAGSLIGTIVGAVIGVGVGLAVAGASCVVLSIGCVLTVLPIVTLVGGAGGIAGLVLGGGPGLINGVWNYYTTMQAAPGASQYADQIPAFRQSAPAPVPEAAR